MKLPIFALMLILATGVPLFSNASQLPPPTDGALELRLTYDGQSRDAKTALAHFTLVIENSSKVDVKIPADINDHAGSGTLQLYDAEGKSIPCAHAWPQRPGNDDACWNHEPEPEIELQTLKPGEIVTVTIERRVHGLEPGSYHADFWYITELGRAQECPELSPEGYLYGPLASEREAFVLK